MLSQLLARPQSRTDHHKLHSQSIAPRNAVGVAAAHRIRRVFGQIDALPIESALGEPWVNALDLRTTSAGAATALRTWTSADIYQRNPLERGITSANIAPLHI